MFMEMFVHKTKKKLYSKYFQHLKDRSLAGVNQCNSIDINTQETYLNRQRFLWILISIYLFSHGYFSDTIAWDKKAI